MILKQLTTALRGSTLSGKMTRAVTCLTAAILLLTFLVVYHVVKREMQRIISVQQFDMVTSLAEEIDDKIGYTRDHLSLMASQVTPETLASQEHANEYLDHQRDNLIIFDKGLYLLSPELSLLAGNHEALSACNGVEPISAALENALETGKPLVSKPFLLCGDAANPVILFAAPIVDRKAHVSGLLAGVASLLNEDFLGSLRKVKFGEGGYVYLYSQERLMILHPDRSRVLKQDVPPGVNQMFDHALEGFEGSGETVNSRGLHALSSFKRLKTTDWILAANLPVDEAYAPVDQALGAFLPIFVGMLLLAGLVTLALMHRLTSPLALLSERFADYDLDASMDPIHLKTGDELEILAGTYNQMLYHISEQQDQLKEEIRFLEVLLEVMPNPVYFKDNRGRYLGCNQAFEGQLGISRKDLIGKTVFNITPEHLAPGYHQSDLELLARGSGQTLSYESQVMWGDGELHDAIFYKTTYSDSNGKLLGLIGTIIDITQLRQSYQKLQNQQEELQGKNAELERFIYTVSHDLKSPVVTIKAFLGLLEANLAEADPELIKQDIQYIHNAADKLGRQIDELLEMSRIGRVNFTPEHVSFHEVVDEAMSYVAGAVTEKAVKVTIAEGSTDFFADRTRLVEIWQNLLENAVKYMGAPPSPGIEVGFETTSEGPCFLVRDNGMGIPPRYQDKIFELFEKLDPKSEGTGLGLAMVKRIVEHYGGTIHVESQGTGRGCCFRFTLPQAINDDDQSDAPRVAKSV